MNIFAPCYIQLMGTEMHHTIGDWVVPTVWLFAQITDEHKLEHQRPCPLKWVIVEMKCEDFTLERAYEQFEEIQWLCVRSTRPEALRGSSYHTYLCKSPTSLMQHPPTALILGEYVIIRHCSSCVPSPEH